MGKGVWDVVQRKASLNITTPKNYEVKQQDAYVPRSDMVRARWMEFMQAESREAASLPPPGNGGSSGEDPSERRKRERNRMRSMAWKLDRFGAGYLDPVEVLRRACKFADVFSEDVELIASIPAGAASDDDGGSSDDNNNRPDPMERVHYFGMNTGECSDADTDSEQGSPSPPPAALVCTFFRITAGAKAPTKTAKYVGTRPATNRLSGYEIVPNLREDFREFVAGRDRCRALEKKAECRQRILEERSEEHRSVGALPKLFDEVVEAFLEFMGQDNKSRQLRMSGFKYCPTPGSSADKVSFEKICISLHFLQTIFWQPMGFFSSPVCTCNVVQNDKKQGTGNLETIFWQPMGFFSSPVCNCNAVQNDKKQGTGNLETMFWQPMGFFSSPVCTCNAVQNDKKQGTGNLETEGIGMAMLRRLGFASFASPTGGRREFKEWLACYRLAEGVAESFIGRGQLKQINYARLPTLHATLWVDRIHRRHNAEGYAAFEQQTLDSLKEGRRGVNTSHLDMEDLYDRLMEGSSTAELQFLSLVQKTRCVIGNL